MLHIAGADHFVDQKTQAKMHAGLDDHPKVTLHDYPGEDHGFATEMGQRRSEGAARLADRRTAADCAALKDAGHEPMVQAKSGLLLDPYFSGSKIGWALKNWPQLREAGDRLAVGTIESYLVYRLTRSEEHTSELQSLMRISYAVFCLKKKKHTRYQSDK